MRNTEIHFDKTPRRMNDLAQQLNTAMSNLKAGIGRLAPIVQKVQFRVNYDTKAFQIGMEKISLRMMPIRFQFNRELHQKISNRK